MIDRISLAALDTTANDYESAGSICAELSSFLGQPLSEAQLFSALRSLESLGLVEAYRAASDSEALVPASSSAGDSPSSVWFLATSEGRRVLEREWEPILGARKERQ
jgi:DNA-binding PadR family transcriptional regulator